MDDPFVPVGTLKDKGGFFFILIVPTKAKRAKEVIEIGSINSVNPLGCVGTKE